MSDPQLTWQAAGLVLGLGLAWTSVHCAGMCGPLVVGLRIGRLGALAPGDPPSTRTVISQLGAYQFVRAAVYALLGAAAGWTGAGIAKDLHGGELWLGIALAAAFFIAALVKLGHPASLARLISRTGSSTPVAALLLRALPARLARRPVFAAAALGAAMAFLPCGIVLWALGLAAASADPLQGALVMVILVAMTTPALAASTAITAVASRWRGGLRTWCGRWLPSASLAFSGAWILFMAISRSAAACCHHLSPV
jgi:sulfite exporter TauE/SafE